MSVAGPRRYRLGLSDERLALLRQAVDASLNVPAAMAVAERVGRRRALEHLEGDTKIMKRGSRDSVLKRRAMGEHAIKKKSRSGRSNWPRTLEERLRVKARTEERKALGLPPWKQGDQERAGLAFPTEPKRYDPSSRQSAALHELAAAVATTVGVAPKTLSLPHAVVSMIADDESDLRRVASSRPRERVRLALFDNTTGIQFAADRVSTPVLRAGEILVYDRRQAHREPRGDWRRVIDFDLRPIH